MDKNNPSRMKKGKPHNARPYDRPNQGIFGKVASKVKGLLNPSWLFSVPHWIRTNPEDPGCSSDDILEEEEPQPAKRSDPQAVLRTSKRPRLKLDGTQVDSNTITQTWLEPGTSKTLFNNVTHPNSSQIPSNTIESEPQLTINGDDRSENSEGSASTSGCSSLVSSHKDRLNHMCSPSLRLSESALENLRGELKSKTYFPTSRRDLTPQTERNNRSRNTSLWSSGTPSMLSVARPPSVIQSTKPSFNLTTFGGPSKVDLLSNKKVASPFYEGKTAFGGASSARRIPISVAPYQAEKNLRNQIRVKENRLGDNSECMSSAAKRILQTLEKMSTPVMDAKKIPNTSSSPVDLTVYMTPPSHRKNSYKPFSKKIPGLTKGPPIANINTIAKLTTLKNYSPKRPRVSPMEIPYIETKKVATIIKDSESVTPYQNLSKGGGGKMRSKLNQNLHLSSRENAETEVAEEISLPNIPLPITKLPTINLGLKTQSTGNSLIEKKTPLLFNEQSSFTFASPIQHLLPKSASPVPKQVSDYSFEFSSPLTMDEENSDSSIVKARKNSDNREQSNEMYSGSVNDFLKILSGKEESETEAVTAGKTENKTSKKGLSSCVPGEGNTNTGNREQFADKGSSEKNISSVSFSTPSASSVTADHTKHAGEGNTNTGKLEQIADKGSLEKHISSVTFSTSSESSVAPDYTKHAVKNITASYELGSWECSTCCVRNHAIQDKCVACESKKQTSLHSSAFSKPSIKEPFGSQSGFGDQFKLAKGSWECSSCMVRNKECDVKCVACDTSNPNHRLSNKEKTPTGESENQLKPTDSKSKDAEMSAQKGMLSSFIVKQSGTWECDTCLVRNPLDKSKCIACETLRPSQDNTSSVKNSTGFKFGSAVHSSPITFKVGCFNSTAQDTPATSSFKFGASTISTTSQSPNVMPLTSSNDSKIKISETSTVASGGFKIDTNVSSQTANFGGFVLNSSPTLGLPKEKNTVQLSSEKPKNEESSKLASKTNTQNDKLNSDCNILPKSSSSVTDIKTEALANSEIFKTINSGTLTINLPTSSLPTSSIGVKTESSVTSAGKNGKFGLNLPPNHANPKVSECFKFGTHEAKPVPVFGSSVLRHDKSDSSKSSAEVVTKEKISDIVSSQDASVSVAAGTCPSFKFSAPISVSSAKPVTTSSFGLPTLPETSLFKFTDNINTAKTSSGPTTEAVAVFTSVSSFSTCTSIPNFTFSNSTTKTVTSVSSTNSSNVPSSVGSVQFQNSLQLPQVSVPFTACTTSSSFTFGNPAVAPVTSLPGFSFFTSSTTTNPSIKNPSIFSFGASSNSTETSKSGGFTFTGQTEEKSNSLTTNTLNYQTFKQEPANTTAPNSTAAGVAPTLFKFGGSAPSSSSGFVFGAQKTESQPSTVPPFAFGSSTAPSGNTSTFPGFQPQSQTSTPVAASNFQFGSSVSGSTAAPTGFRSQSNAFTFGAKSIEPVNQMAVPPTPNTATAFGCTQMQPTFGGTTSTAPTFGKTIDEKTPTSGFNFGSSVAQAPVFRFGAAAGKKPAVAAASSGGFTFGGPVAAEAPAPNNFPSGFSMSTPPSFNFGATSTPAGPFQFAASNESRATPQSNAPRRYRKAVRRGGRKE